MMQSVDTCPALAAWRPNLGACPEAGGVSFCTWAPTRKRVDLVLNPSLPSPRRRSLTPTGDGMFTVTTCGLRFRREPAGFLLSGAYRPLESEGPAADHLVAFARHDGSATLLAIVPWLVMSPTTGNHSLPRGPDTWASTRILLPPWAGSVRYRHLLTGTAVEATERHLPAAAVFRTSPVALLWAEARAQGAERDAA